MRPIEEQEERESQRLWYKTVIAIKESNHIAATEEKSKIEDRQREETAKRAEQGIEWQPKLFRKVQGGPGSPEEGEEDLDWVLNANMWVEEILNIKCPIDWPSDGATPLEKTRQILALAPIVKNQPSIQQAAAPSAQEQQSVPQHQTQPARQPTNHSDLIDFGQAESAPPAIIPDRGSSLNHTAPQAGISGLQEPLVPGAPLKRVDTATNELDEFVDAKP